MDKFIPKESPEKAKKRLIKKETKDIADPVELHLEIDELQERVDLYQKGILNDPYMRKVILSAKKCARCGREFSKHKELHKVMHHNIYYGKCFYSDCTHCEECRVYRESWFKNCRNNLKCLCDECHNEIYPEQLELWGKENE